MKKYLLLIVLSAVSLPLTAQSKDDGDQVVSVPKKYVSTEGLNHQTQPTSSSTESQSVADSTSKWIGIGREVGVATREGLNAVVDTAEKFGSTKVGNFVMFMVAWRIMAKEVLGVLLGIPLLIGGICLWIWAAKRMFFGYRVLDKVEGHTKFYVDHEPIEFKSSDARATAGTFMGIGLGAWVLLMVFVVIF